ncbi:MAG: hypothetical protein DWQ34_07655 [Planctomycetota bacterium]|nr:MAG: hypothetical protein DWQ29_08765 [Planctomycetota bacterium]REJ94815.1 MAG: hypothetical protein DWQ34_07655 [Planctomycetota bacterium]REK31049.1 MAG: hypothetical protein DWQ41_01085 [Planctomycetota bacterium]REK36835.1 MAG: hypothetical protein DWQ45_09520 [Planctomycetota bacterium]
MNSGKRNRATSDGFPADRFEFGVSMVKTFRQRRLPVAIQSASEPPVSGFPSGPSKIDRR